LKKNLKKLPKLDGHYLSSLVESLIEHRLFKPVVTLIILTFLLFRAVEYGQNLFADYREKQENQRLTTPVVVNISGSGVNFDIDEEQVFEHRFKSGDTMLKVLLNVGAPEQDVFAILAAMKKVHNLKDISSGDHIIVKYKVKIGYDPAKSSDGADVERKVLVENVSFSPSSEKQIVVSRQADGEYSAKEKEIKTMRYISRYYGTIKNGLFVDGVQSGISPTSMMNMINLYGYELDFQRDLHGGDRFEMLVESFYSEDGKKLRDGNVLFSSLMLQNRTIEIYMHKINGKVEYFDAKGNSVRKSLLRTPINGARVSSGFGMRRHPILGYSKMHKGTDFAASTGTPILAAGNGTIVHFGVKGGYGNYVQIKHSAEYATAYGHASRFNRKFHLGSKVKQGDVIAYVGTTGRSTGPHLHFEVLYRGNQINPSKVKATSGLKLSGKELTRFAALKDEIDRYRKNIPNQIRR
jgi:murein DD-endopeptidase MepM/ murein hydrolase activator NlpD